MNIYVRNGVDFCVKVFTVLLIFMRSPFGWAVRFTLFFALRRGVAAAPDARALVFAFASLATARFIRFKNTFFMHRLSIFD